MKFGAYFYPWYNEKRWGDHPKRNTPIIGEYDSRDPDVILWQADLIAWSGLDYVIFEIVPLDDWGFECCDEAIERMIPELASRNVGCSFLIDVPQPPNGPERIRRAGALVSHIRSKGWDEGSIKAPNGKPLMFSYALWRSESEALIESADAYDWRFPVYRSEWDMTVEAVDPSFQEPYLGEPMRSGASVFEQTASLRGLSFWEGSTTPHCFDGFCSVIPGYNDELLRRNPQLAPTVERNEGATFTAQFNNAIAQKAKHILIYGWNEYFETTEIEPTDKHGMFYVELLRRLISDARKEVS